MSDSRQRAYRQLKLTDLWSPCRQSPLQNNNFRETRCWSEASEWPQGVHCIDELLNPNRILFESLEPETECACATNCRFDDCANASQGFFCMQQTCQHRALCGNALHSSPVVRLIYDSATNEYGLQTTKCLDKGVIVGEYLGELKMVRCSDDIPKSEYIVQMKASPLRRRATAYIDAATHGNIMRFANHSCRAAARFEELSYRDRYATFVVTNRSVRQGEFFTVDYGCRPWFICHCGESNCRRPN